MTETTKQVILHAETSRTERANDLAPTSATCALQYVKQRVIGSRTQQPRFEKLVLTTRT